MERFQSGWWFLVLPLEMTINEASQRLEEFQEVEIPHDWLIENTDKLAGGVAETGWYRKVFQAHKVNDQEQWILRFDGIYMDSVIYLNRQKVCEWKYGYTAFEADLTPFLIEGENEIFVSVRYETPNSRWYSGAGIYRSVWLKRRNKTHLVSDGVYIVSKKIDQEWQVNIEVEVNSSHPVAVRHRIRERETKKELNIVCIEEILGADEVQIVKSTLLIKDPRLWELESPKLYEVITELLDGEEVLDCQQNRFGLRTIQFDPDRGFFLNGRHVKLQGVCEHHDLGSLGAAFSIYAMKRKFVILKQMGINAIRISHNMPAQEVMALADEMGLLIASELFDMWEQPKTEKDYARFFASWYQKDVASWVRRDRNCPSVILWSIGNEIYDTHADQRGQEITAMLMSEVLKHDPGQNARVTLASNYMPWENAQKCADLVKVAGYNYSEKYYEKHHQNYPGWVIYGSETASIVQSRGIYHFPAKQQILTDDDRQCSSLGNSITSWGARSIDACITGERDNLFSCGQFIWTGFDYIGEPTPYHTKNSYFGQVDTAGFPKDSYYLYQSAWTDYKTAPMVHVYPYWDFNEGQIIDVGICSNAPEVELMVNGVSQGKRQIDHKKDEQLTALWQIPYKKGEICAIAYDETRIEIARKTRHSFKDASRVLLTPDKTTLAADGRDLIFVTIEMVDNEGHLVENANNRVEVSVTGAGRLVGLDNGDSTDYDEYKGKSRRLFSGKLLAIVQAKLMDGTIFMRVTSKGVEAAEIKLNALECENIKGISAFTENKDRLRKTGNAAGEEIPVRRIEILCKEGNLLSPKQKEVHLEAVLHPANASYQEVEWSVTDDRGIPSNIAALKSHEKGAVLSAIGDGSCRVRCMTKNGSDEISLISQMEYYISGLGENSLNPYGFIYGGVYSYSKGAVGNGNERGIATARDGETQVGFENLDFGSYGSDEITISIFALTGDAYPIQIWGGIPGNPRSELIADVIYQKPSIWNVYQEETFLLKKRIKGVTSICFVLKQKVHIKGFTFKKINRGTQRLYAGEADRIYGDSYIIDGKAIREIGNNVSLEFTEMDFGSKGINKITIFGNSIIRCNSIHILFKGMDGVQKQLVEFPQSEGMAERSFPLKCITGVQNVTFLFLPGSRFDFGWFQLD